MPGQARREVAIELKVVVIGVVAQTRIAVDRHYSEIIARTQRTLQLAKLRLVQEEAAHRERCKVGHKGGLLRAGIVEIGLIGVRQSRLGRHVPQPPFGMPQHIKLIGFED